MSVQANLSNTESLQLLEELGVERAILSRELSLDDIKRIRSGTSMEIETFVHGLGNVLPTLVVDHHKFI